GLLSELAALHFLEEVIPVDVLRIIFRLRRQRVVVVLAGPALGQLLGPGRVFLDQFGELFVVHEAGEGDTRSLQPAHERASGSLTAPRSRGAGRRLESSPSAARGGEGRPGTSGRR